MKADITKEGVLVLYPELEIERYAVNEWRKKCGVRLIVDEVSYSRDCASKEKVKI